MESLREKNVEAKTKPEDTKNQESVAICIPTYGTVTASWLINFMRFFMHNSRKYKINLFIHEQQPVSISRNHLAEMAMSQNPDYIMWIDSDNAVPTGTLERLIETLKEKEADFVTALYFSKDPPYYPVIREYHSGGFWKVDNPALGKKFEIAGAGMGCCLMKADVFDKIEKPYFKFNHETWGHKDIVLSEDLYFCRKLLKAKLKLFCDSGAVAGHIGGCVDVMEYMNFAPIRQSTMMERDELTQDVIDFTGRTEEEVLMDITVGPGLMKKEWEDKNPKTWDEIKKFYKETQNYLYDLTLWHFGERRRYDIELTTKMKKVWEEGADTIYQGRKPRVLDFGCGIGQNAIMLARLGFDVTLADLDSQTLAFAKHRFKAHDLKYSSWETDMEDMPPHDKYDFILAFDVFEHIPEDEAEKIINKLIKLKHENTRVLMSNSFTKDAGGDNSHPMHFEDSKKYKELIDRLLNEKSQ